MLDCVRHGHPTEETVAILKQRVIQVPVSDKFTELQQSGKAPVYLFPKRKSCDYFNAQMLKKVPMKYSFTVVMKHLETEK